MIWNRLAVALRRANLRPQRAMAQRWAAADQRDPQLARDLVRLGRVVVLSPVDGADRLALSAEQMAYEAGRRDMALELLAMMSLSPDDIRTLMEHDDNDR